MWSIQKIHTEILLISHPKLLVDYILWHKLDILIGSVAYIQSKHVNIVDCFVQMKNGRSPASMPARSGCHPRRLQHCSRCTSDAARRTHFICFGSSYFQLNVTSVQLLHLTLYSTRIVCSSNCLALFSLPVGLFSKCTVWILWAGLPLNDENLLDWAEVIYSPAAPGFLRAVQALCQYFSANTKSTKNIIIVIVIMTEWVRVVL